MPWRESTCMSERKELVSLAAAEGANVAALSRQFGVSRKTAYKWQRRFTEEGWPGLSDRSRRPGRSPGRTTSELETLVCRLRWQHPAWGGRKLHHRLLAEGRTDVPAASTITGILRRHGLLSADRRLQRDWQRFEEAAPNGLWQMDFKGHFATAEGRCHPLTVLDDHSRFNICLTACANERAETVRSCLERAFACYGLPERMLMDNGSPWGSERAHPHTHLTAWLIRLGITVVHGRPYHPQTQGKEERFHRTLNLEVLTPGRPWSDLQCVQKAFVAWRDVYNLERPHEALDHRPPSSRYVPSPRRLPAAPPAVEYARGMEVRRVQDKGVISFRGREFLVSRAFIGEPVGLQPLTDGLWEVYYCHQRVTRIDLAASATGQGNV
jgi:transposase InsO family protein